MLVSEHIMMFMLFNDIAVRIKKNAFKDFILLYGVMDIN